MAGFYKAVILDCDILYSASQEWHLARFIFLVGNSKKRVVQNFAGAELQKVLKILLLDNYKGNVSKDMRTCKGIYCVVLLREASIGGQFQLKVDGVYRLKERT
jgi:hypothetical protein